MKGCAPRRRTWVWVAKQYEHQAHAWKASNMQKQCMPYPRVPLQCSRNRRCMHNGNDRTQKDKNWYLAFAAECHPLVRSQELGCQLFNVWVQPPSCRFLALCATPIDTSDFLCGELLLHSDGGSKRSRSRSPQITSLRKVIQELVHPRLQHLIAKARHAVQRSAAWKRMGSACASPARGSPLRCGRPSLSPGPPWASASRPV